MARKTKAKRMVPRVSRRLMPVLVGAVMLGSVIYSYAAVPGPHDTKPASPVVTKLTHHPATVTKHSKKPAAPQPAAPVTASTPAPVAQPAPSTTAQAPAPAPAQAVTTSPTSSVDSLTPTSSPSTAAGSSTADTGSTEGSQSGSSPAPSQPNFSPALSYSSTNWSGYMSNGGTYSAISGAWVTPTVATNVATESGDSAWIGIGGVTTDDLIQVGTENMVEPDGTVYTAAFYELLPDVSQEVPGVTVSQGDSIKASLTQVSASRWTISITDITNGQSYNNTVTYTSTNSSAEWIEEDPSYASGGLVPFDNFGSVTFTDGSTTASGSAFTIKAAESSIITLVSGRGKVLAQPSALSTDGAGFTVTRK